MNQNIIELDWRLKKDWRRNKKSFKYNSEKGTHLSYHSDKNRSNDFGFYLLIKTFDYNLLIHC